MEESVTRPRAALAVVGALCVVLGGLAVLLARDVWRVDAALRSADARARVTQVEPRAWDADTSVGFGLARTLLGVSDDIAFRELIAQARAMTGRSPGDPLDERYLAVRAALVRSARGVDRQRASHAANLLGVFALTEPDEPDKTSVERAVEEFVRAVHLDPANDVAKANLELMLALYVDEDVSRRGRTGSGDAAGSGAGLQRGGEGW
jgi:hypothetical protein